MANIYLEFDLHHPPFSHHETQHHLPSQRQTRPPPRAAKHRDISVNKLIEELATISIAEFHDSAPLQQKVPPRKTSPSSINWTHISNRTQPNPPPTPKTQNHQTRRLPPHPFHVHPLRSLLRPIRHILARHSGRVRFPRARKGTQGTRFKSHSSRSICSDSFSFSIKSVMHLNTKKLAAHDRRPAR